MKISLFGGSFNPIHNGHIKIIKEILKRKLVDEIWIIPCKKHAFNKELASEKDRIEMIKLAIKDIKKVRINKTELKLKGKSYTLKTIKKLKNKYPYKFFLIIGSDILYEIKKWYKYKQLFKEIEFIIFKRSDYNIKKIKDMKVCFIINKDIGKTSSTNIRERIRQGKSLKELVPLAISKYIAKKELYR